MGTADTQSRLSRGEKGQHAVARRPHGLTVAVVGPDGAGKSTLVQALCDAAILPVVAVYMGRNPESSNYSLPTMRWVQRRTLARTRARGTTQLISAEKGVFTRLVASVRSLVTLSHLLLEYTYRFGVADLAKRRGAVVVFDRYIYDWLATTSLGGATEWDRLVAQLFARVFPKPELTLVLEAPGHVLFERKGEHSVERLDRLRLAYRDIAQRLPCVEYLDVTQPPADVLQAAITRVEQHMRAVREHTI